jgi:branched-chain amino acid transport system permease protein
VILWKPLRRRGLGLTQLMIVTIGLSLALQYSYQFFVGAATKRVVVEAPTIRTFGPVTITQTSLWAMAICIVCIAFVGYALLRTRVGRATRAVSDNPALAQASGIDTDKVIRLVWTVSMALAGLSGLLYALGRQRREVGHRCPDPAAAVRGRDARWPRDGRSARWSAPWSSVWWSSCRRW